MQATRQLIFENGRHFQGTGFGAPGDSVAEVVFNTSMVGYQEIFSDPSYCNQTVLMTYPLIGNYGLANDDFESPTPHLSGLVVRDYNDRPTNYRCAMSLGELMQDCGIPGITGVDTRQITRMLRSEGAMRALLTDMACPVEEGLRLLSATAVPRDQVRRVSCQKPWAARTQNARYHVVAVDCGIKRNTIRRLLDKGCNITVVPCSFRAEDVPALKPDGLFLSNGPGDPMDVPEAANLVRALQGKLPIFGICLGHQIIALANGAKTYKMKFGHRGANHPVKNLENGKVEITSQNHSYAVDIASIQGTALSLTHINLLDKTAEGLRSDALRVSTVQYHPESAPGPQDSDYIIDRFIRQMAEDQKKVQVQYA